MHNKDTKSQKVNEVQNNRTSLPPLPKDQNIIISYEGFRHLQQHFDPQQPHKNVFWTSDYRVQLPIRVRRCALNPLEPPPMTIIDLWKRAVKSYGSLSAMTYQIQPDTWRSITYNEYYKESVNFGKACIALNLSYYTAVMIMGFNSPEWAIAFFGSMFAKYLPIGMYTTNSPEVCKYTANHCEGEMVVVEDAVQLKKYYEIIHDCPKLKYFVIYKEKVPANLPQSLKGKVFAWKQFLQIGQKFMPSKKQDYIEYRQDSIKPGNCASFIYTSGTTGMPKAVMVSHDNYVYDSQFLYQKFPQIIGQMTGKGRMLSYLPLSHIAAQLVDIMLPLRFGFNTFYPDVTVLQANLVKFLLISKPTFFLGVPRVWEKIEEKLSDAFTSSTGIKKKIVDWALSKGIEGTFAEQLGKQLPRGWSIAKRLLFNKIKNTLGLDECKIFVTGAAPIKESTRRFFLQLNIMILNVYGMSESSGGHIVTDIKKWEHFEQRFLRQDGTTFFSSEIELQNKNKEGKGQICMRGRNIFMGYYKNEEDTRKTIDDRGFLHSGDEGMFDEKGNMYITGRLKELIITAGGENIPPALIENEIGTALPIVSQSVVIGDKRKYLTCLLCLKVKNGTELTDQVVEFLKTHGSSAKTIKQATECAKVRDIINQGIDKVNKKAISNAQKIQKFVILPIEFTVDNGVLTPTMKVKRRVVNEMFSKEIESMYIESKL